MIIDNSNNMLSVLDNCTFPDADEIGLEIAADFRHRRVEK